jgi:two-component system LytT family response regulator
MNCIIIDDELPARELLEDNIRQLPYLTLAGQARSIPEAIALLNNLHIDLVFLDIQLPGLSGLDFLKSVKNRPMVILVTAFAEHALEGFTYEVIDYLVKPVPPGRFIRAVEKAQELYRLHELAGRHTAPEPAHVFINANYALLKVLISDILFIEGLKDYVRISLSAAKPIITRLSLKSVEEKLGASNFMRVHKSWIIALDKIDSIQKTQVTIQATEIPIGDGYRQTLQQYINGKNL